MPAANEAGSIALPSLPRLAGTMIAPSARIREAEIGRHCEVADGTSIEYATLGDLSYVMERSIIASTSIGKFCSIAAHCRIAAPNHPIERASAHRFTYCP